MGTVNAIIRRANPVLNHRASICSIVRPVTCDINAVSEPSSFILRAVSMSFCFNFASACFIFSSTFLYYMTLELPKCNGRISPRLNASINLYHLGRIFLAKFLNQESKSQRFLCRSMSVGLSAHCSFRSIFIIVSRFPLPSVR